MSFQKPVSHPRTMACFELKGNNPAFMQNLVISVHKTTLRNKKLLSSESPFSCKDVSWVPSFASRTVYIFFFILPRILIIMGIRAGSLRFPVLLNALGILADVPRVALATTRSGGKDVSVFHPDLIRQTSAVMSCDLKIRHLISVFKCLSLSCWAWAD